VEPGTVSERIEFSVAQAAQFRSLRRDGAKTIGEVRQGAERTRVHTYVKLARGQSVQLELRYSVPITDGRYRLRLLPQPLARDAGLRVSVDPAPGCRSGPRDRRRSRAPSAGRTLVADRAAVGHGPIAAGTLPGGGGSPVPPVARPTSVGAAATDHGEQGLPQDQQVQRQGPVLDVVQVEADRLLPGQVRSAADLPQAGQPGLTSSRRRTSRS
jgi:hypothetical protein